MEYTTGALSMRIDGAVFECDSPTASDRIPLDRLAVRVVKHAKGKVRFILEAAGETIPDVPIYGWGQDFHYINRRSWVIDAEEEPGLREFFTRVGEAIGRTVAPAPGTGDGEEGKRRKLFGRH
jgi:hypothetical protein